METPTSFKGDDKNVGNETQMLAKKERHQLDERKRSTPETCREDSRVKDEGAGEISTSICQQQENVISAPSICELAPMQGSRESEMFHEYSA